MRVVSHVGDTEEVLVAGAPPEPEAMTRESGLSGR